LLERAAGHGRQVQQEIGWVARGVIARGEQLPFVELFVGERIEQGRVAAARVAAQRIRKGVRNRKAIFSETVPDTFSPAQFKPSRQDNASTRFKHPTLERSLKFRRARSISTSGTSLARRFQHG